MDESKELIQIEIPMTREYGYLVFQQTHPDPSSQGPKFDEAPQTPLAVAQRASSTVRQHRWPEPPCGWLYSTQPLPSNGTPSREEGPIAIVIAPCPLTKLSMWFGSKKGAMGGTASNLLFFNSHLPPASGCLISVFIFRCYRLELQLKLMSPFVPSSSLKGCFSA